MNKKTPGPYQDHPILGRRPKKELSREEQYDAFLELARHHGISDPQNDPETWQKLAVSLAMTHVPRLRPTQPPGPKTKRTAYDMYVFLSAYWSNTKKQKRGALKQMAKDPFWVELGFAEKPKKLHPTFEDDTTKVHQTFRYILQAVRDDSVRAEIACEHEKSTKALFAFFRETPGAVEAMRLHLADDPEEWAAFLARLNEKQD